MIGLIGAMKIEVDNLKKVMTGLKSTVISNIEFSTGKINNVECVVAISGVGKVNAAMCTQTMILNFSPDFIINVGVAGAVSENIKICDVVFVDYVLQHDMDTSGVGDEKGMISGINLIKIPCSKKINNKLLGASKYIKNTNFHVGTVMTGDQFINDKKTLISLKNEFGGVACEMEAAAIGQVCYINKVDFAVVRAISDNANDNATFDYALFIQKAAKISNDLILSLINNFNE